MIGYKYSLKPKVFTKMHLDPSPPCKCSICHKLSLIRVKWLIKYYIKCYTFDV